MSEYDYHGGLRDASELVYSTVEKLLESDFPTILPYLFKVLTRKKPKTVRGRIQNYGIKVFADKDRLYHRYDVELWLSETFITTEISRNLEALIYTALSSLWINESGKLIVTDPDFLGFYKVVSKYGDWTGEIRAINLTQLELNLEVSGV